jgi:putative flavoprotein involved in K+ transport
MTVSTRAVDIVIIGGGPSGLGISYLLTAQDRPHVVLEQGRIGESWRSQRWDSLRLVGANWTLQLPGCSYQGGDPRGFMPKDEVLAWIEAYARSFDPPVREGVRAIRVEPESGGRGFRIETTVGTYHAAHVVVATGANRVPNIPAAHSGLSAGIHQLPAMAYRNPDALPEGAVLVVGSGETGCQIAEELVGDGRQVYLSAGRCWWGPAWYRGHDGFWWTVQLGGMRVSATKAGLPSPQLTGQDGGRILNLHTLARAGITLLGRVDTMNGTTLRLRPDLDETVAQADGDARQRIAAIDAFAAEHGVGDPPEDEIHDPAWWTHPPTEPILELDFAAVGITTVLWATGYRLDFTWVHLPTFDANGYPKHEMGVAAYEGLYFPALPGKDTFLGVAHDVTYISETILARTSRAGP